MAIRVIESMAQGTLDGKDTKKILDLGPLDLRPIGERPAERTAVSASDPYYSAGEASKIRFFILQSGLNSEH